MKSYRAVVLGILTLSLLFTFFASFQIPHVASIPDEDYILYFDGNDYVQVDDSVSLNFSTADFTFQFWFRASSSSNSMFFFAKVKNDNWDHYYYSDIRTNGKIELDIGNETAYTQFVSPTGYTFGVWHNVVCLRDSGILKLYVDGDLAVSEGDSGIDVDSNQPLIIAGNLFDWDCNFTGYMEEFRVYDRALNTTEIEYGYNNKNEVLNENNLVLWFDFNEARGSTTIDKSGNGNNGTIIGAEYHYYYSLCQDSPSDSATETQWTVNFYYTVGFVDTPKNACLRIFNATDDILITKVWNSTALENGVSINYGSYTFSVEQNYKWDCVYYNASEASYVSDFNWTFTIDTSPRCRNHGQNATVIDQEESLKLYAQGYDGIGLDYAWLATNETGLWKNYTGKRLIASNAANYSLPDTSYHAENIVYDSVTDKYWWCLLDCSGGAGNKNIKLAYSSNPNGSWTLQSTPLVSDGYYDTPHLAKFATYWYLYYSNGSAYHEIVAQRSTEVNQSYSTSGISNPLLTNGGSGAWDENRASEPYLFKDGSTYYLFYMGEKTGAQKLEQTGYATSSYPNQSFTKYSGNPVLPADNYPHGWDNGEDRAADPFVFKNGTDFFVGVTACASGKANWKIGFYRTTDFLSFEHYNENPVLHHGSGGSWDDDKVLRGAVSTFNGVNYFTYSGGDGIETRVGETTLNITGRSMTNFFDVADTWRWSNFTWTNSSVPIGRQVNGLIRYNDTYGNVGSTGIFTFRIVLRVTGTDMYLWNTTESTLSSISYSQDELQFKITASGLSTTQVYCGNKGEPLRVTGASSWTYDSSTQICIILVSHASSQTVILSWQQDQGSGYFVLRVYVKEESQPLADLVVSVKPLGVTDFERVNATTGLDGVAQFELPYGTYLVQARYDKKVKTVRVWLTSNKDIGLDFGTPPRKYGHEGVVVVGMICVSVVVYFLFGRRR